MMVTIWVEEKQYNGIYCTFPAYFLFKEDVIIKFRH